MNERGSESLLDARSPCDLRVMEIPRNRLGLGEGHWLRLPELEAWLRAKGHTEIAHLIHEQATNGREVASRPVSVRA